MKFSFFSVFGHQNPGSGSESLSGSVSGYGFTSNAGSRFTTLAAGPMFDSLLGHVVRALGCAVVPLQVLQEAEEQRVHRHRVHAEEAAAQQVID
jgi:hypothetical protein